MFVFCILDGIWFLFGNLEDKRWVNEFFLRGCEGSGLCWDEVVGLEFWNKEYVSVGLGFGGGYVWEVSIELSG